MRALTVSLGAVAIVVAPFSTVLANDRGGHTPHGNPHTTTSTTHAPSTTTHAPSTTTHAPSTTTTPSPTPTPVPPPTTTGTHGEHHHGTDSHRTESGPRPTRLNPIAQKIAAKPQLSAKVQAMLPKGMTLNSASRGFKNQGQFIAALHASQKNNIPFRDLKAAMLGRHGEAPMSLGQAVKSLRSSPSTTTSTTPGTTTTSGTPTPGPRTPTTHVTPTTPATPTTPVTPTSPTTPGHR